MAMKDDFSRLIEEAKVKRDELKLQMHLASMEAKEEFQEAEKKWKKFKDKALEIKDEAIETSDEVLVKTKIIGEELKETYHRIAKRLSK